MLDAEVTQDRDVLVLHLKWMGVSSSLVEQMPSADHKMELVSVIVLQVTLMEIPTKAVLQNPETKYAHLMPIAPSTNPAFVENAKILAHSEELAVKTLFVTSSIIDQDVLVPNVTLAVPSYDAN
jgi:hypothetical protein